MPIDLGELEATYAVDIARLNAMTVNYITINQIEYAYHALRGIEFEATTEFMLQNEILTTAIVIPYGRLFKSSTGATVFRRKWVPAELRETHDEIIRYRDERYAHHGGHPSIRTDIRLSEDADGVRLSQTLEVGMWVGAAEHWKPLIVWLREHAYHHTKAQLDRLSELSGVEWKMAEGPQPDWSIQIDRAE